MPQKSQSTTTELMPDERYTNAGLRDLLRRIHQNIALVRFHLESLDSAEEDLYAMDGAVNVLTTTQEELFDALTEIDRRILNETGTTTKGGGQR